MSTGKLASWAVVLLAAALIVVFHWNQWTTASWNVAMGFYIVLATWLIWMLSTSAWHRNYTKEPVAEGSIVAIVPAYNEKPEALYKCVESLLNQTHQPNLIVVVDDGSTEPVQPINYEGVFWYRQDNMGKRHAQLNGLAAAHAEWADFIITVDSDSIVAPDGIEQLMRSMSDPDVQAATGACVVVNRTDNVLTRITDLEINLYNTVIRRVRSHVGAVAPTSGPLAVYRAENIWDNAADYLTEGTYSDDRRLTHYSLLRGKVVAVDEAVVYTDMPNNLPQTYKQRTRWFKGYFRYMGWELRNLSGWAYALRVWNLMLLALYPLIIGFIALAVLFTGVNVPWQGFVYWIALLYSLTAHYLERPNLSFNKRLQGWLTLTPLLVIYQALVIRPSMYYAMFKVRDTSWATRGAATKAKYKREKRGRYRVKTA